MKLRHTLIMSAAFLMAYQANAGTPSTIDPAAKEIASMMCRWVLDGGKLTDPAQRLTIYENGSMVTPVFATPILTTSWLA